MQQMYGCEAKGSVCTFGFRVSIFCSLRASLKLICYWAAVVKVASTFLPKMPFYSLWVFLFVFVSVSLCAPPTPCVCMHAWITWMYYETEEVQHPESTLGYNLNVCSHGLGLSIHELPISGCISWLGTHIVQAVWGLGLGLCLRISSSFTSDDSGDLP